MTYWATVTQPAYRPGMTSARNKILTQQ